MSQSFQELGVSAPVIRALAATGITHPFAVQNLVLPDALAGLDILIAKEAAKRKRVAKELLALSKRLMKLVEGIKAGKYKLPA